MASTDEATSVLLHVALHPDDVVENFVPGTLVFLARPDPSTQLTFQGNPLPVASTGPGTPFGIVSPQQLYVTQALAPYRIYALRIIVAGLVQTLVPYDSAQPLCGESVSAVPSSSFQSSVVLGRAVGYDVARYPTSYIPRHQFCTLPLPGTLCAQVILAPLCN